MASEQAETCRWINNIITDITCCVFWLPYTVPLCYTHNRDASNSRSSIMSHESQNANCWEYLMNLPFILDLTKSQHPCITEELQKQTVLYDKYNQMCRTSQACLSYVRLEGRTVLLCCFRSSGKWSYVLGQVVLSVLKALQSFETLKPLAQWHNILSQKTWTLMPQTVWWFCEETYGLAISYRFLQLS